MRANMEITSGVIFTFSFFMVRYYRLINLQSCRVPSHRRSCRWWQSKGLHLCCDSQGLPVGSLEDHRSVPQADLGNTIMSVENLECFSKMFFINNRDYFPTYSILSCYFLTFRIQWLSNVRLDIHVHICNACLLLFAWNVKAYNRGKKS